jgi:transcriptional regulator with XRE-family HTH domain
MAGVRRSQLALEADRRNREQRARIGGEIRVMRERRGWTRTELARRAGIGRMVQSRVERGSTNLDLDVLQRIGVAMDRPLVVTFGRDILEAPVDAGHLAIQELVLRLGKVVGYSGAFELATQASEPWRSIDVGLANNAAHRMVLAECWNTFGDIGAAARSTNRKRSELEDLAVARWGAEAEISVVWIIRASARNRALLQRYPEVFATRFPGSSRAWIEALTLGSPPPREPGIVWCDVGATRIFEWRRHDAPRPDS